MSIDLTNVSQKSASMTTTLVKREQLDDQPQQQKRAIGVRSFDDWMSLVGAALASLSLTAVLVTYLLPIDGLVPSALLAYAMFIPFYAGLVSFSEDGPAVRDKVWAVIVHTAAATLLGVLVLIVGFTLFRGVGALLHVNFFTQDMANAGPLDPLSVGGILHAMVGTLIMISIALAITIPLGILCAVFLNEVPGRFPRFVRTIVEAMTALPSIVAGLFIYATWILILGRGKSGFAAALAISVMMLPIIIRAADVVIRLVPQTYKEASYALGASQWATVRNVVLPTARSGLTTAVILGTARGIGETSPVLLTAGFTAGLNLNPFSGPMISLPLATFEFVKSPQTTMIERGFGTAATLMLLVLIMFIIARVIGGRGPGQLSSRQLARRNRQSEADVRRFAQRADMAEIIPGTES